MASNSSADGRTLSSQDIQGLQANLHGSIATTEQAALKCADNGQAATLEARAEEMADQESQLETKLFALQTAQVTAEAGTAFDGTNSYTAQLKAMSDKLDQIGQILGLADKVVSAAEQLIKLL